MRWGTFVQVLFVLYCVQTGVFLVLAPWSPSWERLMLHLPLEGIYRLALSPTFRGTVTGFGLVHLVWGAHDLDSLLGRFRAPIEPVA